MFLLHLRSGILHGIESVGEKVDSTCLSFSLGIGVEFSVKCREVNRSTSQALNIKHLTHPQRIQLARRSYRYADSRCTPLSQFLHHTQNTAPRLPKHYILGQKDGVFRQRRRRLPATTQRTAQVHRLRRKPSDPDRHHPTDRVRPQVSDALLRVQKTPAGQLPRAGFLADILPVTLNAAKVVAPASTLKYVSKFASAVAPDALPEGHASAVPKDQHWVDMTPAGTVVVIESPPNATAASIGGIMSLRMALNGVLGCVVSGRVRDMDEQAASGIEVWAGGRSSVATGAEAKVWGRECEIEVQGVKINPGDVVVADGKEGCVVVIPRELLGEVVQVIGEIPAADDKVLEALRGGMTVKEAFAKYRGGK